MRKAVVDVGSNSVLLLVGEMAPNEVRVVRETSEVTALGEGTRETGRLGEAAIAGTLEAIARAFSLAREDGATEILAAATMAARLARNTAEFRELAEKQGTPVVVLSAEDEADLGFEAVATDPVFSSAERLSTIDVGGHSTELVTAGRGASGWSFELRRSFPVGTLALRGGDLREESPKGPDLLRASAKLDDLFGLSYLPERAGTVVALGATSTNLVSIRERMSVWRPELVHGAWLDFEEVGKAVGWLSRMTDSERAAVVGIEPGRERTLHLGALILERALHALRASGCLVSVRGWRHALLARLFAGQTKPL